MSQQKVTAYITREYAGETQLLTLTSEDTNWAGVEVPGGTVDPGETLEQALYREIAEESGICKNQLTLVKYLGHNTYQSRTTQEIMIRHNYHLIFTGDSKHVFTHSVESNDIDHGWLYHYEWKTIYNKHVIKLADKLQPGLVELYKLL
ncbi:NUDIX domain-containing protein [Geomicrobium sp. JCM 19055]|uniref:NUDIX domain-containing protein n=1 Tax=Geomicrobium sp. JCM 19055 TaxID=1460649 RepID=UPI00045EDDDD|nr:NUDIX hydrolase [Geomicrobium sp. JCM 19055]GAJ97990.1 MutT/Nudix family protein [Geomicrobium sp. JCM 19055]